MTTKQSAARVGERTIELSTRRALAEGREVEPRTGRLEGDGRSSRRSRARRITREIVADEMGGC
jgi:hypothetical protein